MNGFLGSVTTGLTAFVATDLDDLILLTFCFSQVSAGFRRRHVVIGQYLGFCILLLASLPGFWGGMLWSRHWLGMLGLIPIALGLSRLLNTTANPLELNQNVLNLSSSSATGYFLSPYTYGIAAITIANGTDNLGIYVPLFATCRLEQLLIILSLFMMLVGVWCFIAAQLARQRVIAQMLIHYGDPLIPLMLIGLGALIVLENRALTPIALIVSSLCLAGLVKTDAETDQGELSAIAGTETARPPLVNQ
jgi:cadmium resistance transport/sequestration family protein